MAVILRTVRTGAQLSYATGADSMGGVDFSLIAAHALVFEDESAALAFADGKNVWGAVPVDQAAVL